MRAAISSLAVGTQRVSMSTSGTVAGKRSWRPSLQLDGPQLSLALKVPIGALTGVPRVCCWLSWSFSCNRIHGPAAATQQGWPGMYMYKLHHASITAIGLAPKGSMWQIDWGCGRVWGGVCPGVYWCVIL